MFRRRSRPRRHRTQELKSHPIIKQHRRFQILQITVMQHNKWVISANATFDGVTTTRCHLKTFCQQDLEAGGVPAGKFRERCHILSGESWFRFFLGGVLTYVSSWLIGWMQRGTFESDFWSIETCLRWGGKKDGNKTIKPEVLKPSAIELFSLYLLCVCVLSQLMPSQDSLESQVG